ncbi:unnamed protein product, partial [Phaeothamnion confervicola]
AAAAPDPDPGRRMLGLLEGLPVEGFERSFKMGGGLLLADRFLVGIHKSDIAPHALFGICDALGMPARYRQDLERHAEAANALHFGYEGRDGGGLFKVYLEFAGRLGVGASGPVLLHLAYKWACRGDRNGTIAQYVCHPGLGLDVILDRAGAAYPADEATASAVRDMLRLAASRTPEPLMYLEVAEEGTPRASFDINLHAAGLRVADVAEALERVRASYAIPPAEFSPLIGSVSNAPLGHLSGGTSREGGGFLTVYYASGPA